MTGRKTRRDRKQERVDERAEAERAQSAPGGVSSEVKPDAIGGQTLLEVKEMGVRTARMLEKTNRSYLSALKRNASKDDIRTLEKIAIGGQRHAAAMKQAIGIITSVCKIYFDYRLDEHDSNITIQMDDWRSYMEQLAELSVSDEAQLH